MTDPKQKVRVALLGLGAAARNIHLPACSQSDAISLVAAADPDPNARQRFSILKPPLRLYDDAEKLLDAEQPDWVIIATPPPTHFDLCRFALRRGSHVFCEKPFVERVEDADGILEVERESGRQVAVNHQFYRMPIFEAADRMIGRDEFGKLLFLQAWGHLIEAPHEIQGWRSHGHTMREFGVHVVDLAIRFFRGLPQSVFARMTSSTARPGSDLVDVVTLEFPEDRLASIILDRVCRGAHRYLEMRIDGERASVRISIGGRARLSLFVSGRTRRPGFRFELTAGGQAWLEMGERRRVLARNPRNAFAAATARHFCAVIDAVEHGREPPSSARYSRDLLAVVEAAYASAASGRPVPVEPWKTTVKPGLGRGQAE